MITIRAAVRGGRIEPDEPIDLPDSTEVQITVPEYDDDEPISPEEIGPVLAAMDRMEPLRMSDEELAAWEADRHARKEWEKTYFFGHADELRRMWE